MKTFVILFRQNPGVVLTDADKQRRAEETSPWARRQIDAGHKLEARILGPESDTRDSGGKAAVLADSGPVTALLFMEASDLSEAANIAGSHPALRYGASVEVRPWSPPIPAAKAPQPATAR